MTARRCFLGKVAAGKVSERAAQGILDMLDEYERTHARHLKPNTIVEAVDAMAARKADLARRAAIAQSNVLRSFNAYDRVVQDLRKTPGDLGFGNKAPPTLGRDTSSSLLAAVRSLLTRDIWEIADWKNVFYLARDIRGRAHQQFAEALEYLRPKVLGLKDEGTRELDTLRALYGRTDVSPEARAASSAWDKVAEDLRQQYVDTGGALPERKDWRLPNPTLDEAKVRALGEERFKTMVRDNVKREAMLDFTTDLPLSDKRFEELLDEAWKGYAGGFVEGQPSSVQKGRRMLASSRAFARFFVWKDAEAWTRMAEQLGTHSSVFETMMEHISSIADDIAMMSVLGPNPEGTKRFILDLFDREAGRLAVTTEGQANATGKAIAKATRENQKIVARVQRDRRAFEDLWAEITGANDIPVNTELARTLGDARSALYGAGMGSAILSSLSDTGTLAMTARMNGIPASRILSRAVAMMGEKGSEIFAAQQGVVADTLAHIAGNVDRVMGETIRSSRVQKVSSAVVRASGLRRWTAVLRAAFSLEYMAHFAREAGKAFAELDPQFQAALGRVGISPAEWEIIGKVTPHEARPGAKFIRPSDVADLGPEARPLSEKVSRLINQEMDYAVLDADPQARAWILGQSQPGTAGGETRRAVGMYKQFPLTFMTFHMARAFARGWDGKRLSHGALSFVAMTMLGAVSMQAKEIVAGRDPLNLDPTTKNGLQAWGKAMLTGGGFGVFGDFLAVDKTKFGNSMVATAAGPQFAALESIVGDFLLKNFRLLAKGQETHFSGDALYIGSRFLPGSSLWFSKLAFQREVIDQLALMIDPRSRERFARIEKKARDDWGQTYWWRPSHTAPERTPALNVMTGG